MPPPPHRPPPQEPPPPPPKGQSQWELQTGLGCLRPLFPGWLGPECLPSGAWAERVKAGSNAASAARTRDGRSGKSPSFAKPHSTDDRAWGAGNKVMGYTIQKLCDTSRKERERERRLIEMVAQCRMVNSQSPPGTLALYPGKDLKSTLGSGLGRGPACKSL